MKLLLLMTVLVSPLFCQQAPPVPGDSGTCLVMTEAKAKLDSNGQKISITGLVLNKCGRSFDIVQIWFKLVDGVGVRVADAFGWVGGLADGETWKYEAINIRLDQSDVAGFKFDKFLIR
ncbi:MAG TPA: FxLYD domain-containing protein [Bryobacteraceae bacterium]|jgi:hypothetical protein